MNYLEKLIAKEKNKRNIDYPYSVLITLDKLGTLVCETDGQFTGGVYSKRYIKDNYVYDFSFDKDDSILEATFYLKEFL